MKRHGKFTSPSYGKGFTAEKYPAVTKKRPTKPALTPKERIEALRLAGVDVTHLIALSGAITGDVIASNKDGNLTVLDDNDPIFDIISRQGTVPNPRLFRRFVMAQMFHMLTHVPYGKTEPAGVTQMIHNRGYEYQWKMLIKELRAQMKMERKDPENFTDRNRWFNARVVEAMARDYIEKLKLFIQDLPEKKCKGIPYKRIAGQDIFISDLDKKLYTPLIIAMHRISSSKKGSQLYEAAKKFNNLRVKMAWETPQCKEWVDAFKGCGAFFTMQNLIRFHNCVAIDDWGKRLDKYQSLAFLSEKAEMYKDGEGWRLFGLMKKMLEDNHIDVREKMAQWRNRS